MNEIEQFYFHHQDSVQHTLLALRNIILKHDANIAEAWRYGMPFFYYKKKMFCYLWVEKKTQRPYLGIVEGKRINHPALLLQKRTRMKAIYFDAKKDIPVRTVKSILKQTIDIYKNGIVKIK